MRSSVSVECAECGWLIVPDDQFCGGCGRSVLVCDSTPDPSAGEREPQRAGWVGSVGFFPAEAPAEVVAALSDHLRAMREPTDPKQHTAGVNCGALLGAELARLLSVSQDGRDWHLVFEYELPRGRNDTYQSGRLAAEHRWREEQSR